MTMNLKSIRFDKEFEVETVKAGATAVNPEELIIVRFSSLKKILEELGDAVKLETEPVIVPPIVCVKATIKDDAGTEIKTYGSVNINAESLIPKKFSVETALSRAVSNAVIEYCQFEGRVYSDVAIPPEDEKPVQTATPTKQTTPVKTATKMVDEPEDDMPDEAPQEVPKPEKPNAAKTENLGDYVVPIGNEYTNGKKLSSLSQKSLEWLCNLNATTDAGKEAQAKARAYVGVDNLGDYVVPIGNEYTKGKKLATLTQKSLDWLCNLNATTDVGKEAQAKAKAYVASKK